jgi:hypothetical protein
MKPELFQGLTSAFSVVRSVGNPDVQISGGTRMAVVTHCVAANNQILNSL